MSVCSHHWKKKTISFSKCPNRLLIELFGHRRWHQLLFKIFECFLPLIFRVSQPQFCFSWFRSPCPVAKYFISFQMTVLSVAPAGSERFSECIVLPITWRTFADQNKIILFPSLGKQKKKQENWNWWENTPPSFQCPATHCFRQRYPMAPGNRNVCYSCWRVRLEETAVLLLNIYDGDESKRSQISLRSGCHLWTVIIIQELHFLLVTLNAHGGKHTLISSLSPTGQKIIIQRASNPWSLGFSPTSLADVCIKAYQTLGEVHEMFPHCVCKNADLERNWKAAFFPNHFFFSS